MLLYKLLLGKELEENQLISLTCQHTMLLCACSLKVLYKWLVTHSVHMVTITFKDPTSIQLTNQQVQTSLNHSHNIKFITDLCIQLFSYWSSLPNIKMQLEEGARWNESSRESIIPVEEIWSTISWKSTGTSACLQRSLSKIRLKIQTKLYPNTKPR